MTVPDRIHMNVVDVPRIVLLIADHVFAIALLPTAAHPFFSAGYRSTFQ